MALIELLHYAICITFDGVFPQSFIQLSQKYQSIMICIEYVLFRVPYGGYVITSIIER